MSPEHSWATQTSAGDFLKAIITISANASQNEQSCIGPNELTRQLVSKPCVEKLISDMLKGGNPLTVGVGIVIEVIRKNNSDYDPDVGTEANSIPTSHDPIYLGTLLRLFAQHVPDFMDLILNPRDTIGGCGDNPVIKRRKELRAAFGANIEPLGFDRFKTCELMAELLHCSNMGLLNEIGSEEFIKARDLERERLRAEGKLGSLSNDSGTGLDDDLTMRSSTHRLGTQDTPRKLEVQNATDDDGFEEVTHSADLGEEAREDFGEKLETAKSLAPLSFIDKDDEFVDEPLSSPRLNASSDANPSEQATEPENAANILSPSKELSRSLDSFDLQAEDTTMTSPQSLPQDVEGSSAPADSDVRDSEQTTGAAEVVNKTEETEKLLQQEIPANADLTNLEQPLESLPHPEDKPAPLFAKKNESQLESTADADASRSPPQNSNEGSFDTTMGEAGDMGNSVLMRDTEDHTPQTGENSPITPVVGDYLKMQFVEYKVVPTILVSLLHPTI